MTDSKKAVFISYASQDADAAQRICAALSAVGIEVWFDRSELRGGDAWDQKIRHEIKTCALFIPVISENTRSRDEGYFRLEWKLAVDRSYLIASHVPFLVPVVIYGASDSDERVPERFRELQWTRLPGGATPRAFADRVLELLSAHEAAAIPSALGSGRRLSIVLLVAVLLGAGLVIALGYEALDRLVLSKRAVGALPVAQSTSLVPGPIPEHSIAVLPFADMSESKDQEYFSDGLCEELIDLLTKIPELRVPARTSSFYFKGKSVELATIAQKLRVANVLEGSVRKVGDRLRVTAQLIRADNGYHLWSETYDRQLKDVFEVQDEIAAAVVAALRLKLGSVPQATAQRTSNTEAYNEYLLGRQFHNRGSRRQELEAFRKAVAIDPHYAAAYASLAIAELYVADQTGDTAGNQRAMEAADKAVELAPGEADNYAARGYLRDTIGWDWSGAQADLAKALALDPGSGVVQRRNALLLASVGRLPEAIAHSKKDAELDPLSNPAWEALARFLFSNGDLGAADDAVRRGLAINPESVLGLNNLGTLQLLNGHPGEALATFGKIDDAAFRLAGLAMSEHSLGHLKESQQAFDELRAKFAQEAAEQIAEVYAWRGEKDQAFEWLERAYQQRDGGLVTIKYDPLLASLRGDARYRALLKKMKLPE
ncbi:MAG TPA: TIR domain-containing protein [Steroidobacteraceae bacterium]